VMACFSASGWAANSAARVLSSHGRSHRFESCAAHYKSNSNLCLRQVFCSGSCSATLHGRCDRRAWPTDHERPRNRPWSRVRASNSDLGRDVPQQSPARPNRWHRSREPRGPASCLLPEPLEPVCPLRTQCPSYPVGIHNNGLINRARFSHIFSANERFIHSTCDKRSLVAKYLSCCSLSRAVTSAS
jgi:hypothetical protein